MKIELREIAIKDIVKGYTNDNDENGVTGYSGLLNIRPKYQREFIYKDSQRDEVLNTIKKDFPLNILYWVKNADDTYEVLDGQQRTISVCDYIVGKYSINFQYFHNLPKDEQKQILNYKLMIYFCEGKESEKLDWFTTINIAGEKLYNQELRNAIYTGPWLSDAKKYFSKLGCPAYEERDYLKGKLNRQDFLETAIKWVSNKNIEKFMAENQLKPNASELWQYFQAVMTWVKITFPNYRKEMKTVEWGLLYNKHKDTLLDSRTLEDEILSLMKDEDVTKKSGIYNFVLSREEKHLNIRTFSEKQKRESYEKQGGICPRCGSEKHYDLKEMEADHIIPWSKGGRTELDNCQMLCKYHNGSKSAK